MRVVASGNGARWLGRGFSLFRSRPLAWLSLVLAYWLMIALLGRVPYIGAALSTVLLPVFTMSFMTMCAVIEGGGVPRPSLLFSGFRRQAAALIALGVLYLLCMAMVLALSAAADGGDLAAWVLAGQEPTADAIRDGKVSRALLVAAVAGSPVLLAFWFAPQLVVWDGMGVTQSLFYSFFAGWRNWRAFLVYGAMLMLLGVGFLVFLAVAAVAAGGRPEALRLVILALTVGVLPVLFGSFYASYRDVFPEAKVPAPAGAPGRSLH